MFEHASVLVREVIESLQPGPHKVFLDGTVGGGGHSEKILLESGPDGRVLGLDRDGEAIAAARRRLQRFGARFISRQGSFAGAKEFLGELGWTGVDGAVLDLGVSSHQLDAPERGFSFRLQGRLDMRMDRRQTVDAQEILNSRSEAELERIFREYGEERKARRIALAIVVARKAEPIRTTAELVAIIERVKGRGQRHHHPATQVFQALRIAVNEELRQLESFIETGYEILLPGARMAIIAFHSLEDRMVKTAFRKWSRDCLCPPRVLHCQCGWSRKARLLTKRPIVPSVTEIEANPRARSARLRVVERV